MEKIKLSLISILVILLMACTSTNNPLSSEIEEDQENNSGVTILYDTSGNNENG